MTFYLGTDRPLWLETLDVPLFLSNVTLRKRRRLPRARVAWALDSGAYTELERHGRFRDSPAAYAERVQVYADEVGRLAWAAPQDWPAAPPALAKTGLTVAEHVERTVQSYLDLRELSPHVIPALQGWRVEDYLTCVELYRQAGVDLALAPVVAVGSIAPRQGTPEAGRIVRALAELGLRLHGLGVKTWGLLAYGHLLESADSFAWSLDARFADPLPGCTHAHCTACHRYALRWRSALLDRFEHADRARQRQLELAF